MKKFIKFYSSVLPLVIYIICGFLCGKYCFSDLNDNLFVNFLFFCAVLYIGFILQIIIHEAGHLVFGLLTGYKFQSFRIGSFMWIKENDKIVLKKFSLAGTGGQCLLIPPELKDGKIPVVLYNLGGIIFNLISSAVFWTLSFIDIPYLSNALLLLCFIGITSALTNGIPMNVGGISNDGMNIINMFGDKKAIFAFWRDMKMIEMVSRGQQYSDMPEDWFEMPTEDEMQNPKLASTAVYRANRLLSEKQFDKAKNLICCILNGDNAVIGVHRKLLANDLIYLEILDGNNHRAIDLMTKEQQKFMHSMKNSTEILRTGYAYALLVDKDKQKAEKIKQMFEKKIKTHPYKCDIITDTELMSIAEQKLQ